MRKDRWLFALLMACFSAAGAYAQQVDNLPPAEPPKQMPGIDAQAPTLRANTHEVLVPTLVEKGHGDVVYGLRDKDFVLEDNGIPQKIHVQEDMDTAPVALVVAYEQGRMSPLEFDKIAKLGPLLDLFLSGGKGQAALVGFDSEPHLVRDFTRSGEVLTKDMHEIQPGDGGAAILDTLSYAVDLLAMQPRDYRRVLLVISEERDHGSKHTKPEALIKKIGESDVLVLSVAFSPSRAELLNDMTGYGQNGGNINLLGPLMMAIQAFRKNVSKEIAVMSGGEYTTFTGDKGFEDRVAEAAKHVRNRYLISFHPTDLTPGLHALRVRTAEDYGARIVARANYWAIDETQDSNQ